MADYDEPPGELSEEDRDYSRMLKSFMEEIKAVDGYHQRVETAGNDDLRGVVRHNRDQDIEHANLLSMVVDGVDTLNDTGVEGPCTLLLGPGLYKAFARYEDGGYQLRKEIEKILVGRVALASAPRDREVLLSERGDDFELILEENVSVRYETHDFETVLYSCSNR